MRKKSITLTEVIVGSIILATAFGSLLATFLAVKRYIVRANRRLVAANLARTIMDELYVEVREDTWHLPNQRLSANSQHPDEVDILIGRDRYTGGYNVSADIDTNNDGEDDYRQVDVNIRYPGD